MIERYKGQGDYVVGYRRAPVHSRFKKGQCGNPKGRPRKSVTVDMILAEELHTKVAITENGRRVKTSKLRLLFKQAVNQGIAGNFKPLTLAMKLSDTLERLNRTPTKNNRNKHPYADIDTSKLSSEELHRMLHEALANTKPLDQCL